jgi:hypothetical protein
MSVHHINLLVLVVEADEADEAEALLRKPGFASLLLVDGPGFAGREYTVALLEG